MGDLPPVLRPVRRLATGSPSTSGPVASSAGTVEAPSRSAGSNTGASTSGSSEGAGPSPIADGSYSDFYRKSNARHETGGVVNGWAAGSPPTSSPSSRTNADAATQTAASSSTSTSTSTSSGAPPAAVDDATAAAVASGSSGEPAPEVSAALARAQAALQRAETSLDDIERLNSSLDAATLASLERSVRPPSRWEKLLALARGAAVLGTLGVAMLASHAFGLATQWAGAAAGAALIAGWGLRKGSLAPSGAAAAFVVGCGTLGSSLRLGATLVAFFLSSSKLTAYKEELKEGLEENAKKGGQRSWVQVLCNGLVPTVLAVVYGVLAGCVDLPLGPPLAAAAAAAPAAAAAAAEAAASAVTSAAAAATGPALEAWRAAALTGLMGGFLGYYACCCGDTWASELGPLSADTPRLITTLRPVRRGTNGGVTLLGLSASIMGGMFIGLVFYLAGLVSPTLWIFESQRALAAGQWRLIPLGLVAGLAGSVLDSLLGATLQYSGYDTVSQRIVSRPGPNVVRIAGPDRGGLLDNNAVNLVSASLTSALTAFVAMKLFGF
ncbi:hypothetical protein HXX76_011367 [Chlamydomonas incerta]|uniref:Transmembrane protein 19 n=1 Tax=Chlamydomonas incerta TaxID=51695 RepID=A0A835SK54_CHLIN|nr:hypothetical protein HXX76_011367 [Chlamydomonas incerta]|eukprot:KAG2428662.1 hypothetical protein HXX76_011367 [Chlamydomonas incerta]